MNRDGKCERDAQYRRIIFGIRGKYAYMYGVAFGPPIVNDCYLVFANQSFNVTIAHDTSEIRNCYIHMNVRVSAASVYVSGHNCTRV